MKVAVLGGTFNPVHNGHISLATCALESYAFDKVLFMPTGKKTYKTDTYSVNDIDRLEMLKIALTYDDRFDVDDYEMNIGKIGYTSETLDYIHEMYPNDEIFFIIGADSLMYIHNWHKPEEIFKKCTVVSGNRIVDGNINQQRKFLEQKFGCSILLMDGPDVKISSSDIRNMLALKQYDKIREYMPQAVLEYIVERKLYIDA